MLIIKKKSYFSKFKPGAKFKYINGSGIIYTITNLWWDKETKGYNIFCTFVVDNNTYSSTFLIEVNDIIII